MLRLFCLCRVFLLERDRKRKNYECDGLGNSIPYKMSLFQPPRSKTVENDAFLEEKCNFSVGGKHCNMTILTMSKIST